LRLGLVYDVRDRAEDPRNGIRFDFAATGYPAIGNVDKAFGVLSAGTAVHYSIAVPLHPILVLRANARKLLGEFPFHESAFIGGSGSVRTLELQRYAGDASLVGTTELRLPLGRVPLILPLDLGIYGFADAGRVFVKGASPGGWHTGTGVGFWVGILNPATALDFELGAGGGRTRIRLKTGMDF
jgi:outer membrane protein assembly factor BamA